jgi:DNA-binding response OmpR family regulator
VDRGAGGRRRLLVVDDEKTIRTSVVIWFERLGFEVDDAADLTVALELIRDRRYDVAMLDLNLGPDAQSGGLTILRELAASKQETAVIILTAFATPELRAEAERLGARAVLSKPQPLAELERIAAEML